ncbi:MAG: prepilin-type N-terminal cleavage/methylation domain-containing protein [Brevinematales bacterium]|nr:prepilin-type N-terminal cleavage/methylation domain-containing protein [Brevinematales bacterium]
MISSKHWISGFTLIEVLVALSLVSISILAVVGILGTLSLTRERTTSLHQIASEINGFLCLSQATLSWTNWHDGLWRTNLGYFPIEIHVTWTKTNLCLVKIRGFFLLSQRTNQYEVETAFSYAYEQAF